MINIKNNNRHNKFKYFFHNVSSLKSGSLYAESPFLYHSRSFRQDIKLKHTDNKYREYQPLTAPTVRPEMKYCWKNGYAQAIGNTIITTIEPLPSASLQAFLLQMHPVLLHSVPASGYWSGSGLTEPAGKGAWCYQCTAWTDTSRSSMRSKGTDRWLPVPAAKSEERFC